MKARTWLLLFLLTSTLLLSACGAEEASTPAQPDLVLTLLDVSSSTEAVRSTYLAQVERIVGSVPAGARLVILPVSANSLTAPAAFDATFPTYTWWQTNSFTHNRQMNKLRQEAMEAASALFEQNPGSRGTALVDSLVQVQEYLRPFPEGSAALYIISDMVEQSQLLDLYDLKEAGIEEALQTVEQASRLPSLRGATVTVAGLEASSHIPAEGVLAIRHFWEKLFERAGGELVGYSPTLHLPATGP